MIGTCPIDGMGIISNLKPRGSRRSAYRNHLLVAHAELSQRQWADLADRMVREERPNA